MSDISMHARTKLNNSCKTYKNLPMKVKIVNLRLPTIQWKAPCIPHATDLFNKGCCLPSILQYSCSDVHVVSTQGHADVRNVEGREGWYAEHVTKQIWMAQDVCYFFHWVVEESRLKKIWKYLKILSVLPLNVFIYFKTNGYPDTY